MRNATCRVCGGPLFAKPLLEFAGMPKAAQHFPSASELPSERGVDLSLRQCSRCGLAQLDNEPVPYYRDVIRAAAVSGPVKDFKRRQFADFIAAHSLKGRKVLEVGCGRGEFLSLLPPLGVDAFGLEHSPDSVAACRAAGLEVSQGYLDGSAPVEGAPFDAFLLLMFLEHMPRPNEALRVLRESLAPGAPGLIEVPNFDMVLRKGLFSEFIGDHLLYFSAETLRTTLSLNGFEVLDCAETRDAYVLSATVRKREAADVSDFEARRESLKAEVLRYLDAFGPKRVAIWGAGHQALALIALLDIAGRIEYVVDSAPFKQGRFTPATHLPVLAPSTLLSDPVDAVIVMAASYSDEVASIIRRDYPGGLKVSILRETCLEELE
jgi:SAM-dependent methyltransferase